MRHVCARARARALSLSPPLCAKTCAPPHPPQPQRGLTRGCRYYEGDCHTFYGYSGTTKGQVGKIQRYGLELGKCTGVVPPDPQCQRGLAGAKPAGRKDGVVYFGTTGLTGIGLLLVALAMFLRRRRTMLLDERLALKSGEIGESQPLSEDGSSSGMYGSIKWAHFTPGKDEGASGTSRIYESDAPGPLDTSLGSLFEGEGEELGPLDSPFSEGHAGIDTSFSEGEDLNSSFDSVVSTTSVRSRGAREVKSQLM